MGHIVNQGKEYRVLGKHLDTALTGAPDSPAFRKILRLLFTEEEAKLAPSIPFTPAPVRRIARWTGVPEDELIGRLDEMARKGLVVDLEIKGRRYAMLTPVVIGFFEMTFMRARDDAPMAELAGLFREYMGGDDRFAKAVFAGSTQLGRSLVREETLPDTDFTEILDWERATRMIEEAGPLAVSLCACRHHNMHEGTACDAPMRTCLTLGIAANALVHHGMGERVSVKEALAILDECKRNGLAQTGDNVQRSPTYICNCCGCCCGMMQAIRTFDVRGAIVTSNWIAGVDDEACKNCGLCEKACPVGAFTMHKTKTETGKTKRNVTFEPDLCLGCGVCATACKTGAITMRPREKRVFTPETVFDKMVAMGIERGKLHTLVFNDPEKLSHRAISRIIATLETFPPTRALTAVEPLKSRYFSAVAGGARKMYKNLADDLG